MIGMDTKLARNKMKRSESLLQMNMIMMDLLLLQPTMNNWLWQMRYVKSLYSREEERM
jgi:hypothetical protein